MSSPELQFDYHEILPLGSDVEPYVEDKEFAIRKAWVFRLKTEHPETGNEHEFLAFVAECLSESKEYGIPSNDFCVITDARDTSGFNIDHQAGEQFADLIEGFSLDEHGEVRRPFKNVNVVYLTPTRSSWLPKDTHTLAHLIRGADPKVDLCDSSIAAIFMYNRGHVLEMAKSNVSKLND